MNAHRMSIEELARGIKDACELASEAAAAGKTEAARLILDGVELGVLENLVHTFHGDRAKAAEVHRKIVAAHGGRTVEN